MEIKINVSAPEMVEAINNLASALTNGKEVAASTRASRSKATQPVTTPAVETPAQQPQQPTPQPVQQPQQCGDCNTYTPDTVLTSVGNCNNPAAVPPAAVPPVNGFVPTAQPACGEYQQPMQQMPTTPQYASVPTAAPVQQPIAQPPQQAPTTAPTYTLEQLALAATQLVDAGKRELVTGLMSAFGIPALTALPKERYGEFALKLRELGAKL